MKYKIGREILYISETLLVVIIGLFLFTSPSKTYNIFKVYLPTEITYMVIFFLISMVFVLNIRNMQMDFVSILLLGRCMLFTVGLFFWNNYQNALTRYLAVIISFIVYTIFYNLDVGEKKFANFCKAIFIVLCIQTIVASINALGVDTEINNIKVFIRVPIGGSNYISCFLVLLLPIIITLEENSKVRKILLIIGFLSIIATRSVSGIVCLTLYSIILFGNIKRKRVLIGGISFIVICISSLLLIQYKRPDFFARYLNVLKKVFSGDLTTFFDAFNGRFDIYFAAIHLLKDSPILGYGVGYANYLLGQLAHNWIIESLLQAGMINLLCVICIWISIFRKCKNKRGLRSAVALKLMLILVLIQGLVEPNLFAFSFDFFFWMCVGGLNHILIKEVR